ncbi:hypothetical protein [Methylosinus sp. Sm6]|uniref:hypothetical protein n=1 Tax=Methylosinus sp. Sm6 TaxID=2866948 RepID=UPI001C98F502|nr:hypothetical protein [Methylosinus sp. Sm6]MBY6244140.1 hypothetical protein [Methylosinus sp. Sm6]
MRGKSASKPVAMLWWRVIKARDSGGTIHGRRRQEGDVFEAPESAMTFDVLEGLVQQIEAPALAGAPAQE